MIDRKKILLLASAIILAVGTTLGQEKFKVYGFSDAQLTSFKNSDPFLMQIVGKEDLSFKLNHVNLYFDWAPNAKTKALVEVALITTNRKSNYNQTQPPAKIMYNGKQLTPAQAKDTLAAGIAMGILTNMIPDPQARAAAISTTLPGIIAQVKADPGYLGAAGAIDGISGPEVESQTSEKKTFELPRAYFDINLTDALNFRVGKWITPSGIWNVDHGSPVVLTINQPYQVTVVPVFPEGQTGLMAYGRTYLGDNDLSYNGWVSTGRSGSTQSVGAAFDNNLDEVSDLTVGGRLGFHLDAEANLNLGATAQTGAMKRDFLRNELTVNLMDLQTLTVKDYNLTKKFKADEQEYIYGFDLKAEFKNFLLQGESNNQKVDNNLTGLSSTVTAYYGLLAYKHSLNQDFVLTPYGMFEHVGWEDGKNSSGLDYYGFGLSGFESIIFGLNLSIYNNVRVKVEWNQIEFLTSEKENGLPVPIGFKDGDLTTTLLSTQFSVAF